MRTRRLPALSLMLVAATAVTSLLTTGCVADDRTAATFEGESTLPAATVAPAGPAEGGAEGADDGEGGGPDGDASTVTSDTAETTTTTVPLAELQGLAAEVVAEGFDQPILVTSAPGLDLLFVVEREGVVRVVEAGGQVQPEPFLDVSGRIQSSSIEQGLLGLVFHPDHAANRLVYAYWTDPNGDSVLASFTTTNTPEFGFTAEEDSEQVIFTVDQPAERHNAGGLAFGPDGYLYLSLGDGGSGGDTAQDTSNPLGSIVRLDVDSGAGRGGAYSIPSGNPFGDEIWVYGLRNPWRFSIDAESELVYIGDVGQEQWEEINVVGLDGGGANFGWIEMEGDRCFRSGCDPDAYTLPALQYSHEEGCSVTGGHVYRGSAIPEFTGHYFYGDWCKGWVRSLRYDPATGTVADQFDWTADLADIGQVTSFGLDANGELLTVNWEGKLHRIIPIR